MEFGFWILDFGSWILDFGFWILDFGFSILEFGFWILDFGLDEALPDIVWILHKIFPCHADSGRRIFSVQLTDKHKLIYVDTLSVILIVKHVSLSFQIKQDVCPSTVSNMNLG